MMDLITTLALACWAIFLIFIFATALFTKRTVMQQSLSYRLTYIIPLLVALFLLLGGSSDQTAPGTGLKGPIYPLYVQVLPHTTPVMSIGLLLTVSGLLVVLWARVILGSNWSGSVTLKENHELVEKGPYAYVRHPIYSGVLLMFLGTAIIIGNLGGFIGFPVFFISCWIKIKQEEILMIEHFGEEYPEYMTRTKALIPYLL